MEPLTGIICINTISKLKMDSCFFFGVGISVKVDFIGHHLTRVNTQNH